MSSAWKLGLSNIAAFWSAIPTLKFAWAGAARMANRRSATTGRIRVCMVVATGGGRQGCGLDAKESDRPPPKLGWNGEHRDHPDGQAGRAAARAARRARRIPVPGLPRPG